MQQQKKHKHRFHLNSLWSIWYGILATYLQGYLVLHGAYRFLGEFKLSNVLQNEQRASNGDRWKIFRNMAKDTNYYYYLTLIMFY